MHAELLELNQGVEGRDEKMGKRADGYGQGYHELIKQKEQGWDYRSYAIGEKDEPKTPAFKKQTPSLRNPSRNS